MKKMIGHPSVGCLVDFFHLYTNEEDYDTVKELRGHLVHAHLARPNPDRLPPMKEDEKTIRRWMEIFREIGYDERLVVECAWRNAAPDYMAALERMRPLIPLLKGNF